MKKIHTILNTQATAELNAKIEKELNIADPTEEDAIALLGAKKDDNPRGDE